MDKEKKSGMEGSVVDDLFRKGLEGLSPQPSARLQKRIHRKMLWKDLYTFNIARLSRRNGFRFVLLGLILLLILFLLIPSKDMQVSSPMESIQHPPDNTTNAPLKKQDILKPAPSILKTTANPGNDSTLNLSSSVKSHKEPLSGKVQDENLFASSISIQNDLLCNQNTPSNRKDEVVPPEWVPFISLNYLLYAQRSYMNLLNETLLPGDLPPVEKRLFSDLSWYTGLSYNMDVDVFRKEAKVRSTNSAQFILGLTHHQWLLETGIAYSYAPDRGYYDAEFLSKDSIGYYYNVKSITVNPSDPTQITYEVETLSIFDSVPHTTNLLTRDRYSYLRIPLILGYSFYRSDRFALAAMLGGEMLLMLSRDVPIPVYVPENGRINGIIRSDPVRRDNAFGILTGMRGAYRPYKNVSLILEPNLKYYVNVFQKQENSNVTQPFSIGVRAGIIISINP